MASWGLARGPESKNSREEGWSQAAHSYCHPTALLSGESGAGIPVGRELGAGLGPHMAG